MASPLTSRPASLSRSHTLPEEIRAATESILHSSLSHDALSTSSTATTICVDSERPVASTLASSARTTTRTREPLRSTQPELEKARDAAKKERAIVERLKHEGASTVPSSSETKCRIRQLERDVRATNTESSRRSNAGLFKAICSTDLLFLIDTTASMGPHIHAAKEQVKSIVNDITEAFFNEAEVRIAVVG